MYGWRMEIKIASPFERGRRIFLRTLYILSASDFDRYIWTFFVRIVEECGRAGCKKVCSEPHGHNLKNQASSFAAIKACYPFTIKGELFSLLCYQPRAFPVSLKTLISAITCRHQCLPQIWNGQTKAQRLIRFILGRFSHTRRATCRSYRVRKLPGYVATLLIRRCFYSTLIKANAVHLVTQANY